MPRWWALSQTPASNGRVSRNVRMISSPHSRPWRGAKHFLRLVSLSRSRKTDALEKHTPNQRLSICVPATPQMHILFGSPWSCFQHALWSKRKFRDVFSSITIVTHVFPRWRAWDPHADQSWGSLQGLSDLPVCGYLHPTNLCHRIIVCKWSAQWQMVCDQF